MRIKQDIEDYLKNLDNYQDIKDALPASNLTIITELLAGFGAYQVYKYQMMREETYLQSAKLKSSVYAVAKTFGYVINRKTAPVIQARYNSVKSLVLKNGDNLGRYGDYDIVYYGPQCTVEKGDLIDLSIGYFNRKEYTAHFVNNELLIGLAPIVLSSIDNNKIDLKLGNKSYKLSKDIEDYLVYNSVIDYSEDINKLKLFVSNTFDKFGTQDIIENDVLYIEYLETDGYMDIVKADLELNENFLFYAVVHNGTNGDSIDKIKKYAPLLYSTMRRMVTNKDHEYIIGAHSLIKSVTINRDIGIPYKAYITLDKVVSGTTYSFTVNGVKIEAIADSSDTINSLYQKLIDRFNEVKLGSKVYLDDNRIYIEGYDGRDEYTVSTVNMNKTVVNTNTPPLSCTLFVNYIKYNTTNEPIELSSQEGEVLSEYSKRYKLSGVRLIFIKATKLSKTFDVNISLYDNSYKDIAIKLIQEIVKSYELKLGVEFSYGKVLADIANIQSDGVRLIDYVLPNQEVYNYSVEDTNNKYLIFDNININIV